MDEDGEIVAERRVPNDDLGDFAADYAGGKAAIEATSNYYHIYEVLSEHLEVQVANPNKLQTIASSDKKTDRVDANQLARLCRLDSVPESYVPAEEIRECRVLVRGRTKLVQERTEMVNKIHGLLTDQGITQTIKPLSVAGREVLADLSLPTPWDELLESYLEIVDTLSAQIERLDDLIAKIAAAREETQLLMSIPGVSHYSAVLLYAEIGEVDRFDTAKQVVSYVGLNPVVRESGDSRFEGSISKRGPGIVRWQLVQSSYVAVHTCQDEYLGRFYDRLNGRKDSKTAIVATARKMLVSLYHMLDRQEVYDPPGVSD